MTSINDQVADLLRAGRSIAHIITTLHVSYARVRAVRDQLGIPRNKPGSKPESVEETFRRRTIPTDDGHLLWPTTDYHIKTVEGAAISAGRYAFGQKYGRRPVGKVQAGCGVPRCVHPDHVEDQPMRQQYAAIFGRAA
ncbi:hypothetical protein ACIPQA_16250 [Streptomyces sp. NPDC090109]|uniref:hypothetical protein n=1 Tax=Streptomyces sp. NPDC090109 TaxID=3365948 RepID=UPI00381D66E9